MSSSRQTPDMLFSQLLRANKFVVRAMQLLQNRRQWAFTSAALAAVLKVQKCNVQDFPASLVGLGMDTLSRVALASRSCKLHIAHIDGLVQVQKCKSAIAYIKKEYLSGPLYVLFPDKF